MKKLLIMLLLCVLAGCSVVKPEEPITITENSALSGKVICIDPGHGITSRRGKEPVHPAKSEEKATNVVGASGLIITEEALNLEVSLKLKAALEEKGAVVYITRQTHESDMSNIERAEFANERCCDISVRLHADGSENKTVSGISILVPSEKSVSEGYLTSEITEKSRRSAELILTEVCKLTGAENRGIIARADLTGFNWSAVPAVLLEIGFLSNQAEEEKLVTAKYQALIAEGIVSGLEKYFIE